MVAGHLRDQNGIYQIILSWKSADGKRRSKSISTGLQTKGNKKRAEAMLMKARAEFDPEKLTSNADVSYANFLQKWLKDKAAMMNPEWYSLHTYHVKSSILPFFTENPVSLKKLSSSDLENFFRHERVDKQVPAKLLLQYYEIILATLTYAIELGWLSENPAEHINPCDRQPQLLFTHFLEDWLQMMQTTVKVTTYAGYAKSIRKRIIPYFDKNYPHLRLAEVTAKHIQDYYTHEMLENKLSSNTIKHRHANIHKALQYAYTNDLIHENPANKVTLPRIEKYIGNYYNATQLDQMFELFKDDPAEFGVITASFYGLRRSEIVGLKWDAIDFERKTITIRHTVTEITMDGKMELIISDSTKTQSSYRTLPLVAPFEKILLRMRQEQEQNQRLCGKSYCQDYLGYIYVNEMGELIKPGYLTSHFPKVLEKNHMPKLRFHDLRHSCASLLFAQGISLKEIQAWLGHSTIATTANIYTHLDERSKMNSANAILSILPK